MGLMDDLANEKTFVLSDADTGYSDESMRFGSRVEMNEYMAEHEGQSFRLRIE